MNYINTTAPISIENLKKFFIDKSTSYIIDYDNSTLQGSKFLTYFSNIDIPCDIVFDYTNPNHLELLKEYIHSPCLVNIPTLENAAMLCLLEMKTKNFSMFGDFIDQNIEMLTEWSRRLDSLTLFNVYSIQDESLKQWARSHQVGQDSDNSGINFVRLIRNPLFDDYLQTIDAANLRYYPRFFEEYCFNGSNLYSFWANENNSMFLMTWAISTNNFNVDSYLEAVKESEGI
jgi:hypothetical protein